MVLKIRLARFGNRHSPVYNIVLAQARTARNSRPIEVLGTYDPIPRVPLSSDIIPASSASPSGPSTSSPSTSPKSAAPEQSLGEETDLRLKKYKNIQLDSSRVKYWLGVGAQPSEPAARLLSMVGLIEGKTWKHRS